MRKTPFRKIHVLEHDYLWKTEHIHVQEFIECKCAEKVTIVSEHYRGSYIQLVFKEDDNRNFASEHGNWIVGYPDTGVVWNKKISINFNRPAVIAALIHHFRNNNWAPGKGAKPIIITDALRILNDVELPGGW